MINQPSQNQIPTLIEIMLRIATSFPDFPDFTHWDYRIASFNQKLLLKGSNSVCTSKKSKPQNGLLTCRNPQNYFYQ